jgi:hypothetical protein
MKALILSLIALTLGVAPVKAQIFQPNVVNGAIVGGIAGAIIGNNSGGHHAGEGAIIGTAAGAVIGSLAQPRPTVVYERPAPVVYEYESAAPVVVEERCEPAPVYYGYGYQSYYGPRWGVTFGYGYHDDWHRHDRDDDWRWRDRDEGWGRRDRDDDRDRHDRR